MKGGGKNIKDLDKRKGKRKQSPLNECDIVSKTMEEGIYVVNLGNCEYTCLADIQDQCIYTYMVRTSHTHASLLLDVTWMPPRIIIVFLCH